MVVPDPANTFYPSELQDDDMGGVWYAFYTHPLDLETKLSNEVAISTAPDYANPEFEAVEVAEAEGSADDAEAEEEEED